MNMRLGCGLALLLCLAGTASADGWQAGVAKVLITPREPMPMAGYASRGAKHADGKLTELWVKALVLQDAGGERALLLTFDLIGIDRALSKSICDALMEKHKLKREQIALNFSHTHTGPVVAENLRPMHYMLLGEADRKLVRDYARFLEERVQEAVQDASSRLAPSRITWQSGTAGFAVNRRNNPEGEAAARRKAKTLAGPFDHDVPVLCVRGENNTLRAVVFGYACHNTTLDGFQWSGDYAGFAQAVLERLHPDAVAMYWAGCGGDQNPLPRRKVELAHEYGERLAQAANDVLNARSELRPVKGKLAATYAEVDLPLAELPTREELQRDANSTNQYAAARARHWLAELEAGRPLPKTYPYPVQTWRLGEEVLFVFLGGEVVVDYAIRLKDELGEEKLGRKNVWVAGYSNDVMAYIPSRRVLTEGGYEGAGAMVYYGLPAVWSPEVEEVIIREVKRQADGVITEN